MKTIYKIFIILLLILIQVSPVFSFSNDSDNFEIQLVGMPAPDNPDDIKKQKPTSDPDPEEYETANPPDIIEKPDTPGEYDPDNPYAEWER